MPEYLAPGVYVEEISTGPRPIQGVSTSLAGFVGLSERGPDEPTFVSSWVAYQRWYGRWTPGLSFLADAVQGFFDNGGRRAFVARVTGDGGANLGAESSLVVGNLVLTAIGRGAWGDRVYALIEPGTLLQTEFRLTLVYFTNAPPAGGPVDPLVRDVTNRQDPAFVEPDVIEVFDNLAPADGAVNSAETVVNAASRLVRLSWQGGSAMPPTDPNSNTPNATFTPLAGGADGATPPVAATFTPGLERLAEIDEISLLIVPDEVNFPTVTDEVINQCERLRDRFAVVSALQAPGNIANFQPPRRTSYGAFYHPWIEVFNPRLNRNTPVPPTGHIAGIIARTDIERGVHKAPANELVVGARKLVTPVTFADQTLLNPRGVNCIRNFGNPDVPVLRLWGARTMSSDPEWTYINVRRLFLYLEESIDEGTQWVVFEPNDQDLWAKVRRTIEIFLVRVWRSGALMGTTQDEAFFVRCDRSTMTEDDIANGRLICLIGVAPVKPAEFVIFRISQKTADASS